MKLENVPVAADVAFSKEVCLLEKICLIILLGIGSHFDIRYRIVIVKNLLYFAMAGVLIRGIELFYNISLLGKESFLSLAGGIIIGLVVLGISKLTKNGIGTGDGLLLCVTGVYLGFWKNLEMFFMALCLAAACSALLLITKRAGRKTQIPFVPFLGIAYLILLAGEAIQ